MNIVQKDMLLGEVVAKYPQAAEIMLGYGLHCVGCFANAFDTVEVGAKVHGMTNEQVDEMVGKINAAIGEVKA
jgi:hybrid cluster-associated redox disulfide protein